MAEVSADDNSIQRFIVQHYRYAPERHEPRNVIVAAFDNEAEFKYRIHELSAEVERRRSPANPLTPESALQESCLSPGIRRCSGTHICSGGRSGTACFHKPSLTFRSPRTSV